MSVAQVEPRTIEVDPARQFDFWLGEWDCAWERNGVEHVGTNSVYADLGGCVLVENFDARPSLEYQGLSFSVSDREAGCWKQTWVDSEGGYLDFAGHFEDGVMELRRHGEVDGVPAVFRMRWENIEPESLDWSWQRSVDDGETWTTLWSIRYSRVLQARHPELAAPYARRDEERLAARRVTRLRELAACGLLPFHRPR